MTTLRICKDCKHLMRRYEPDLYFCDAVAVNLVTGLIALKPCDDERSSAGTCGPSGVNFIGRDDE